MSFVYNPKDFEDIPDYEDYQVDIYGNVWSKKSQRLMKPQTMHNGYLRVKFCLDGKKTRHLVHRLVALTYLKNPNNYPQVNHIDYDKQHNFVGNLEWSDATANNSNHQKTDKHSSKYTGVSKQNRKWKSHIQIDSKKVYLGMFDTEKEAKDARENYITQHNLNHKRNT